MKQLSDSLNSIFGLAGKVGAQAAAERAVHLSGARAMKEAKALAATIGVEIERDTAGGWWVTRPGMDPDPLDGNHFCSTGNEVLEAVKVYEAAKESA